VNPTRGPAETVGAVSYSPSATKSRPYGLCLFLSGCVTLSAALSRGPRRCPRALVATLRDLFAAGAARFLMHWGRRKVTDAADFMAMMHAAGFTVSHPDRCVYEFTRPLSPAPVV